MGIRRGNQNFIGGIKDGLVLYYDATSSFVSSSYGVNPSNWNSIAGNSLTFQNSPVYTGSIGGNVTFNRNLNQNAYYSNGDITLDNATMILWGKYFTTQSGVYVGTLFSSCDNSNYDYASGFCLYWAYYVPGLIFESSVAGGGYSNAYNYISSSTTFSANTWYHITFTIDSSWITCYLNGIQQKRLFRSNNSNSQIYLNTFCIGSRCQGTSYFFDYCTGSVAQAMIYNRALSSSEVVSLYSGSKGRFGL